MKKNIELFLKGMIIGIGFIIPGVSGGTLAVLLGIYEELIDAAGNFYKSLKEFKKAFKILLPLGIGAIVSIALTAKIIELGLKYIPIITILVFLGMILGSIPKIFKSVKKKPKLKEILLMLIGIIIVVLMLVFVKDTGDATFNNIGLGTYITLFFIGMLASATMVIPGISGSATLMMIGYYNPILNVVNELTSLTNITTNLLILLPFGIGVIVGIVVVAKIIDYFLDNYHDATYHVIIGFVLSSIISIFYQIFGYEFNLVHLIIGLILMCINSILVYKYFEK